MLTSAWQVFRRSLLRELESMWAEELADTGTSLSGELGGPCV